MFGLTTGDGVRLADTELVARVERDLTLAGRLSLRGPERRQGVRQKSCRASSGAGGAVGMRAGGSGTMAP